MAYIKIESGYVNAATAQCVIPAVDPKTGDPVGGDRWTIYDSGGDAHDFTCTEEALLELLAPHNPYSYAEEISYSLDRIADLLDEIAGESDSGEKYLRVLYCDR